MVVRVATNQRGIAACLSVELDETEVLMDDLYRKFTLTLHQIETPEICLYD